MLSNEISQRLFAHQLEQPRSILCLYASWPLAIIALTVAMFDSAAAEWESVLLELVTAMALIVTPAFFKTEHRFKLVRLIFSALIFSGFLLVLLLRSDSPLGLVWLPVFPMLASFMLGQKTALAMLVAMWLCFLLLAPLEQLGVHLSVMLLCTMAVSTIIATIYEWALSMYHARLSHLIEKDPLTGIANRRAMLAHLDSLAFSEAPLATMMIDIDHFKQINDRDGHQLGDAVLMQVGSTIAAQLRGDQRGGRWGGDEFLLLLPGVDGELARQIGERLRQQLQRDGGPNLSIGVAVRQVGEDIHALVHRADQALYRAKSDGRNRISIAPPPANA